MAATNVSAVTNDLQTYFSKRLLDINYKDAVLQTAAYVEDIPSNSSKTISFTQYSRLSVPGSVLTEGTAPTDTQITNSAVTAVVDQWGAYVTLTDLAELTVKHPLAEETLYLLGQQATETIESTINGVLVAGTTVQYANGKAARTALGNSDVMTTTELRKAVKVLQVNGARPLDSGNFVLFVDPSVAMDILADSEFRAVTAFAPQPQYEGAVLGTWYGVEVRRSNVISTISSTVTVHTSYLVGRNAYAITNLQNLQTYIEGPGSVSDPLHQKRTLGWKVGFKSVILNNNFMVRIESGSAY